MNNQIGRYWAIFYQPLPESGERIVIALVLEHSSANCTVEFDENFAKVRKVFPDLDADGMAFTLSGLQTKLNETDHRDFLLASLGPQISASTARRAALPFTDKRKASLMSRYVLPAKSTRPEPLTAQEQRNHIVTKAIQGYIRGYLDGRDISVEVSPKQIVGRNIPGVRTVAIGIPAGDGSWTVMDGVDLNQSTAQSAERRADDIGRGQRRGSWKDYVDLHVLTLNGIDVVAGLSAARAIDPGFDPAVSVRALQYYGDGTLDRVPATMQRDLSRWAQAVDLTKLPVFEARAGITREEQI